MDGFKGMLSMDITTKQRSYKAPPKRLSENLGTINTRTYYTYIGHVHVV